MIETTTETTTKTLEYPLHQSRRGGKIHYQGCGTRSHYVHVLHKTVGMTVDEVRATYGDKLCRTCFPKAVR